MLAHGAEQSEAGQWAAHYAKEAALDTVPNPAPPRPAPPRPAPPRPALPLQTCPISTEGWTRRVRVVREGGGGGTAAGRQPRRARRARADGARADGARAGPQALCVEQRTPYPELPARPAREQDAVARRMAEEAACRAAVSLFPPPFVLIGHAASFTPY